MTSDLGASSSSDIKVEFDWDEALHNLGLQTLEGEVQKEEEDLVPNESSPLCIYQRLQNLHREEASMQRMLPHLYPTSHLLDKLVEKGSFNMVVLTLYPCNKGYSVSFCSTEGLIFQEMWHPYSQDLLLDYIDNEQLPPPYLDYWEQTFPQLFYSGSVIVKVKDYRHTQEPLVRHVLLKPHTQSVINDSNLIIMNFENQNQVLSTEEKISVESAVVNTVHNPLCLSPSLETGLKRFHTNYVKNLLCIAPVKSAVSRNSQLNLHRKRKEPTSHLSNFIAKKKKLQESIRREILKPSTEDLVESLEHVYKNVNELAKPSSWNHDCDHSPKLIEKYIFEPDQSIRNDTLLRDGISNYHIKLEISQSPANLEYFGTLSVGKDSAASEDHLENNSSERKCSFSLGAKASVNRYIENFTDRLTRESDGKPVRITHIVPGQPARETCTPATLEPISKNQKSIRIQNNGKTFMQIGPNAAIGNIQQSTFRNNTKISVQQFPPQTLSGKNISADCTPEGAQFNSTANNASLSRLVKTTIVNNICPTLNRSAVSKQKIVSRKLTIDSSLNNTQRLKKTSNFLEPSQ